MLANYHTHTYRCNHAFGEDRDYIEGAIAAGLQVLGFSDHIPWPNAAPAVAHSRMHPDGLGEYFATLTALQEEYRGRIKIHIGFEAENFPELEGLLELLEPYPCEYLILGHHFSSLGDDAHYFGRPFDDPALLDIYAKRTLAGIESGRFLYLAHPDLPYFTGSADHFNAVMEDICLCAKEHDLPLEVNMLGLRDNRNYPTQAFFERAAAHGNRLCVGVDAHKPQHLTEPGVFEKTMAFAQSFGLPVEQFFLGDTATYKQQLSDGSGTEQEERKES